MRPLSVQEMLAKTGQVCKECLTQQRKFEVDREHPLQFFKQHKSNGAGSFVLAYPPKYSDNGLCYYHDKKKKGLFTKPTELEQIKITTGRAHLGR